jgi:hypothetical protein
VGGWGLLKEWRRNGIAATNLIYERKKGSKKVD